MKTTTLVSLAALTCTGIALGAANEADTATRQLHIYPKNLARQHVGTNLFIFNPANQSYGPTEAAAAWLDDDVTTGYPITPGKQAYILVLSEPQLLTNFCVSARPASGTITLYAGDAPAAPGAKSWSPVVKDASFDSLNDKKLSKPFSRFAKYLLIETDIADPGALYSLYLYSEQPAVTYSLRKRDQPIDTRSIFGQFVNLQTSFNISSLYSDTRVTNAGASDGFVSWQKAIDENPESSVSLAPSTTNSALVVQLGAPRSITRVAVLADAKSAGTLDVFVVPQASEKVADVTATNEAGFLQVSNPVHSSTASPAATQAASVEGLTPAARIVFNGENSRGNADFPAVQGSSVLVRWSPANGSDPMALREFNAFSDVSLSDSEVAPSLEAIAERRPDRSKDGKDFKDPVGEGPKEEKEPIKELTSSPFLPGALGFPPVLTGKPSPLSP